MPIIATQNAAAADNWLAQNAISGTPPVPPPPPGGRAVVISFNSRAVAYTDDGVTWTLKSLPSTIFSWTSVAYGGGQFVAVSRSSVAATSPDGVTWTQRTLPSSSNWISVTYGANTFVAVVQNSTTAATSPDGMFWTARALPTLSIWENVTYGANTFVAVSIGEIAATSPDGITWTQRTLPTNVNWEQVLYLQDRFFTYSRTGPTAISTDQGATWTSSTQLPALPAGHGWQRAAYSPTLGSGQGRLVVIEGLIRNSDIVAYSDDQGQTWTETTTPVISDMTGITWNGSAFIVVCTNTDVAFTSPDGITWTERTMPATTGWGPIASAV